MYNHTFNERCQVKPNNGEFVKILLRKYVKILIIVTCVVIAVVWIFRLVIKSNAERTQELQQHLWSDAELGKIHGMTEAEVKETLGDKFIIRITISKYCDASYLWHYPHIWKKEKIGGWVSDSYVDVIFCERRAVEIRTNYASRDTNLR